MHHFNRVMFLILSLVALPNGAIAQQASSCSDGGGTVGPWRWTATDTGFGIEGDFGGLHLFLTDDYGMYGVAGVSPQSVTGLRVAIDGKDATELTLRPGYAQYMKDSGYQSVLAGFRSGSAAELVMTVQTRSVRHTVPLNEFPEVYRLADASRQRLVEMASTGKCKSLKALYDNDDAFDDDDEW